MRNEDINSSEETAIRRQSKIRLADAVSEVADEKPKRSDTRTLWEERSGGTKNRVGGAAYLDMKAKQAVKNKENVRFAMQAILTVIGVVIVILLLRR